MDRPLTGAVDRRLDWIDPSNCPELYLSRLIVLVSRLGFSLFSLSIPLLVVVLTWVNKGIVFDRAPRTVSSVLVLGLSVLAVSTAIILVGLLAAANLKTLMIGA